MILNVDGHRVSTSSVGSYFDKSNRVEFKCIPSLYRRPNSWQQVTNVFAFVMYQRLTFFVPKITTSSIHLILISSTVLYQFVTLLINVGNNLRASLMSYALPLVIHLTLWVRFHHWMMSNERVEVASALSGVGNWMKSSRMLSICQLLSTECKVAAKYPLYTLNDHASDVRLTFSWMLLRWSRIVILVDSQFSKIPLHAVTRDGALSVGLRIEIKFFNFSSCTVRNGRQPSRIQSHKSSANTCCFCSFGISSVEHNFPPLVKCAWFSSMKYLCFLKWDLRVLGEV